MLVIVVSLSSTVRTYLFKNLFIRRLSNALGRNRIRFSEHSQLMMRDLKKGVFMTTSLSFKETTMLKTPGLGKDNG